MISLIILTCQVSVPINPDRKLRGEVSVKNGLIYEHTIYETR